MKPIVTLALTFLFLQGLAQPTIDQFMSAPSASGLAVSADGKQLAWILNERGKRNIFFRNTTGQTRQLTSYDQDDGQELSQLTFSPDGSRLIFVRGGDQSREGHSPNPSSLAEGVDQAIWCAVLATNEIYKLAVGSEPVFYPDGKNLLFSKGPQIQTIAVEKGSVPSQLFFSRGNNGDPRFSPDGKEIVFVSYRRDHNFIGVYTLATKKIRWISPEVSMDLIPVWSPDGKRIAFIRMPGLRADELISFVGGRKFSVWVADAATGKGAAIWNSPADDGGFAQMYPSPLLSWTKTDRLLFFSEHEGWDHVYSIRPDGSDIRDITPGNGEVESYTLDAAGANIYFDGNREDIDRRHIWKSGVADGKVLAVTSGEGIEMYPSLAGTELYCMRSTINQPAAVTRYEEKTRKFESLSALSSPSFASQGFVRPEQVIFKSPDGTTVHGQLFIDRAIKGGGYLTAMGLARNPELFKAGVDLHGVHDWSFRAREFSPGGGWGITGTDMGTAYLNSPVSDLSKWTAPVLLVCGDDDRNVLFQETTDLAERLREKKIPTEILVLPDEVHGFLRYESWRQVFEAARDFFDRKLKG